MRRCSVVFDVVLLGLFCSCSSESAKPGAAEAGVPVIAAVPLAPRHAAEGKRFVRLDSATTGLAFSNELRPENIVAYVYSGAGLAVGDYDGDGLPDVYLVSQDGPNKLFKQTSPMRFEDVTAKAGGLDGGEAWGTSATFADVDGDRDLDLYVCNLESPNLLYLNQGDGTFVEKAGPFGLGHCAASMGCAFADCDNDGDLDLYVLANRVLKNRLPKDIVSGLTLPKAMRKTRAELWRPLPVLQKDERGNAVVPAGHEDEVFLVPGSPEVFQAGQSDRLFRNDGYARWVDVTREAGLGDHDNGLAVVWWDYDRDGRMDLYVANDFQSPDHLWHNLGGGRFADVTKEALPHTAFFGMGADFGDLDGDGRFDLLVADMSSTTHYMGKMLMGSMDQHRWFLMHANPQQYMRNALYVNTGTGRFLEAAHLAGLASSDWTWAVRFVDLDEDGRLDFFATNGIPVFTDNPDINEQFDRLIAQGRESAALEVFRAIPRVEEKNIARRNAGELKFEDVGPAWGLDEASVAHGAVFSDLDRDGDLDLIVNNLNAPASLFENRTADTHRVLVELRGEKGNTHGVGALIELTAGGVTQTRLVSLTRGYMSAGEAVEHFGLGKATAIDRLVVTWPSRARQEFEKLAVDQHYTIREAPPPPPTDLDEPDTEEALGYFSEGNMIPVRHRERDFDDYAVQPLLPHRLSRLGPGVASGDVDGDGSDEMWFGGAAGQAGTLVRADSKERMTPELRLDRSKRKWTPIDGPWRDDAECEDMGACFLDCDGDGDLDLYVVSGGVEAKEGSELLRDRLYVNDGKGAFTKVAADVLPDLRVSKSCVCGCDFDRDGDVDLFVGGRVVPGNFPNAPSSFLLRNDGGRFADATDALLPALRTAGMVTGGGWTDLDDDGFVDLVVAAQWQPIRVFHNDAGKGFTDRTQALGLHDVRGQWNSVAAADLDGDGDMDLVAGNLGLNTKYKASAEKPLRLYGKDFDANGSFDVVEAKQPGDTVLPVRGLSCSSQAMPFVREKFPTYDAFAKANLAEIYGGDTLKQCLELTCNELRHLVLENRGDRFVTAPLPRMTQIAPVFGIGIADFDGDGWQDLVLAQNFFSPEPETGRFDGGLGAFVRGKGSMQFEFVGARESGLRMPGDQKGLVVVDLSGDGSPGVVCSTNDGPVCAYVSGGVRDLHGAPPGVAVRLVGKPGNPVAIGARVEMRAPDGKKQVREITAGNGYLSQSEPTAWFAKSIWGSKLVVRWPDGTTQEHPFDQANGRVTIRR